MALKDILRGLPSGCGVYFFKDKDGGILYIGKAVDIKKRIQSHLRTDELRLKLMLEQAATVDYQLCDTEEQALLLEASLIKENKPKYNVELKDDKSYLYVVITRDEYPRIVALRATQVKEEPLYILGPYPSSRLVRNTLNMVRKIFPFCTCRKPKESCLYVHLKLCRCPGRDIPKAVYRENIEHLRRVLSGERKELVKHLQNQMTRLSSDKKYEAAQIVRDQLVGLYALYAGKRQVNSVLVLKESLGLKGIPFVIDGIDIACLAGQDTTAAAVVFKDGVPDKSRYRKYKIKSVAGIDDFAMIAEVVRRRYRRMKEEEEGFPDLVLVDGGPGQVSVAVRELDNLGLEIPLIGLAKKNEEIYFPGSIQPMILPKDNTGLHLLQKIRDEAHRFCRAYHFILRKKRIIS